ncbi:BnaC05g21720D [Brassica napus]|uniref:BnaC05g21720D protein n=1 Tax=Brassica napus TaxID=3708 RepID=A0A078IAD5_BRANA|nr:BnaC05g21720D [Brassica napus]
MDGNGLYSTRSRGGDLVGTEVCPSDCQQLINVILNKIEWPSLAAELDEIKLLSSRSRVECFAIVDDLAPNRNLRKKERKMEKKQRPEISSTEAVLVGALAPGVNAPTWNALRFAFLLLGLCLTFMLSIAFTSGQSMLLFHVGFLIVIASSLFVLLNWFLAQTGLVPVETQMQELNLAPTTDKSN